MLKKTSFLLVLLLTILCLGAIATPYKGKAVILTQYNGASIDAYLCQEGNVTWYQDREGYPIVKLGDTYYYGIANGNDIVASEYIVGEVDPLFLSISTFEPVIETKSVIDTNFADIVKATMDEPKEIAQGDITPLVLMCNFKYEPKVDPATKGFYIYMPKEMYDNFDSYWTDANNVLTKNAPLYNSNGLGYRHSAFNYLRLDNLEYQWSAVYTIKDNEKQKAMIDNLVKGNESILDSNNDGYIDKIIIVVAGGNTKEYEGDGKFQTQSGSFVDDDFSFSTLKAGYYTEICEEDFKTGFGLQQAIVDEVGFVNYQPIIEDTPSIAFFGQYGDKKFDNDSISTLINNGEWNKTSNTVSMMTRDNVSLAGLEACRDDDGYACYESSDVISIINGTTDKNYGKNINPANFDKNGDYFIDLIVVVFPSEGGANFCRVNDYSAGLNSKKFRNSDYRIGKVLVVSDNYFTEANLSPIILGYTNYMSLARNNQYSPAYNIDALAGASNTYDFLPVNIYEQRQAGYLAGFGTTDTKLGISEINEANCVTTSGYTTFTLSKASNDPNQRYHIAYKIASKSNVNEEFWVEYRTKYGKIGSRTLDSEQDEGLYVYRVNKTREGFGNKGAGQNSTEYVPDEVYFFRVDGQPDFGVTDGLSDLNGDPTKSNIGVYGRNTFSYNTNPSAFFSNGATNAGFEIFNISTPGDDFITFNVNFGCFPPEVVSVTPSNVNLDLDDAYSNGTMFSTGYANGTGVSSLSEVGFKLEYNKIEYLNAIYNSGFNTVTIKNCITTDERGKKVVKDLTLPIGEYSDDGSEIIAENTYLKVNLSKSYWEYNNDKLYVYYMIYPTDNFVNSIFNKLYFDSDDINVYLSAKTYNGLTAINTKGETWINKGVFSYTKEDPIIKFVSATPINQVNKGYFIENQTIKGSYTNGAENIETLGVAYKYPSNDTSITFDYVPRLISLDNAPASNPNVTIITKNLVFTGNQVSVPMIVSASGLFGAYAKGNNYSATGIGLREYTSELYEDTTHKITPEYVYINGVKKESKALVLEYIEENPDFYYDTLCEEITNQTGVTNIINWQDGDRLGQDDLIINGFVSVTSKSFGYKVNGNNLTVNFDVSFDEDKTPIVFGEAPTNNISLEEYGVASLENNFNTIITKPDENTDYRYLGYYGLGYGVDEVKPKINSVTVKRKTDSIEEKEKYGEWKEPEYNDIADTYICDLDKNYYFDVNYKLGKDDLTIEEYSKYKASEISFKLVDSSSNNQLYIKYNPISQIFYAYDNTNGQWITSEFNSARNISIGEFTIPCNSFKATDSINEDGSFDFSFVARSKATFADNPLYIEAQVVNFSGFISDVFVPTDKNGVKTYIYKSEYNDAPIVNSVTPCKGSIECQDDTDFVVTVTDNNGYKDINKIAFNLSYGGVNECLVVYDCLYNTIKILTEKGFSEQGIIGTDDEISNKNFKIDCSKSYLSAVDDFKVKLHLSITPLAAFSGNSLSVFGGAIDITSAEEVFDYKKFGYITIDTDDPNAITLTSKKMTIAVNESKGISVVNGKGEVLPATWSTNDSDIAIVDSKGLVKGIKEGKTKIVANINDTKLSCNVYVGKPDIEYNHPTDPKDVYVSAEAKGSYGAVNILDLNKTNTTNNKDNDVVKSNSNSSKTKTDEVSTSNSSDINNSKTGSIGLGGSTNSRDRVRNSSNSSNSSKSTGYTPSKSSVKLSSTDEKAIANKLSLSNVTAENGATINLRGINSYGNEDKSLVWSSSNDKVATVDGGVVTSKSIGIVTIYAKNSLGKVLSCKVKIIKPQTGQNVDLKTGKSFKLNYINANNWKTTNPDVVSVNERGVIRALKEGIAEIICSANGKTIKSTINVK